MLEVWKEVLNGYYEVSNIHNAGEYQVSYGTIARVVQGIGWEEAA